MTPLQAAAACAGVTVGSATVAAGQTANLAITASGVSAPGVAGFHLVIQYDPSAVTVLSAQASGDFSNQSANIGQAGTVQIAAANAQGITGNPVLGTLSVRAGSSAAGAFPLTLESASLVDSGLNAVASCPTNGTLTVSAAPTVRVTRTLLPSGTTGAPYSQTLSATGGTGPYTWSATAGALPAGLSLNPAAGSLSGMPTQAGLATFTVTATDANGHTASQALQLLINPAGATLALTTTSLPGGTVGTPYTATLGATGGTGPYIWTVQGSLPGGLSLNGATISGTPTAAATANFTVQVTDRSSPPEIATLPLAIVVAPAAVAVSNTNTATTTSASTPVSATVADTTTTASGGTGTVTTSQYTADPESSPAPAFQAGSSTYFDVNVAPQSAFQTLTIQQCGLTASDQLYWWDGAAWASVSPQGFAGGCITATLATTGTSPTISELTGTAFASVAAATAQQRPATQPVAATVGAQGGTLTTPDGAFSMTVPAGSVQGTLSLSESIAAPSGLPSGMAAASPVFLLAGSALASPPDATVTYTASALNGVPPTRVSLYQETASGGWSFLPTKVDASAGTVSARVSTPVTLVALAATQRFPDVASGHWAGPDIDALVATGVAGGFPDGTFQPDATLTRAELVKMMTLALGLTPGGALYFNDVLSTDWFAPYVSAAVQAGIVEGTSLTTFSPSASVTREQLAVMLARALKLTATSTLSFTDAAAVDAWATAGVQEAAAAGYMSGFPDGSFQPQAPTTRAQAAKVLAEIIAHSAP